jgi:hypothetical protein
MHPILSVPAPRDRLARLSAFAGVLAIASATITYLTIFLQLKGDFPEPGKILSISIFWFTPLMGTLAVLLGFLALARKAGSDRSFAVIGILLGGVAIILVPVGVFWLIQSGLILKICGSTCI